MWGWGGQMIGEWDLRVSYHCLPLSEAVTNLLISSMEKKWKKKPVWGTVWMG